MDPYFAVAYFQRGVSQFCIGNMQEAMQDFDHAHTVKNRKNPALTKDKGGQITNQLCDTSILETTWQSNHQLSTVRTGISIVCLRSAV